MNVRVELVAAEDFPAGHDWCLVETLRGRVAFFREDRFGPELVQRAWSLLSAQRRRQP